MARYTGPKARINRRLNAMIYESSGAIRAADRRENPPGMHTRGRRPSNYGLALIEKQKIKHYYGLGERQLRRYFEMVSRKKGNTGELLLLTNGNILPTVDGNWLTTLYGRFAGDEKYTVFAIVSRDDGSTWQYRGTPGSWRDTPGACSAGTTVADTSR